MLFCISCLLHPGHSPLTLMRHFTQRTAATLFWSFSVNPKIWLWGKIPVGQQCLRFSDQPCHVQSHPNLLFPSLWCFVWTSAGHLDQVRMSLCMSCYVISWINICVREQVYLMKWPVRYILFWTELTASENSQIKRGVTLLFFGISLTTWNEEGDNVLLNIK